MTRFAALALAFCAPIDVMAPAQAADVKAKAQSVGAVPMGGAIFGLSGLESVYLTKFRNS